MPHGRAPTFSSVRASFRVLTSITPTDFARPNVT